MQTPPSTSASNTNPTARVEYSLRADDLLSEAQVRQVMEYYLAVRMRRYGRGVQPSEPAHGTERSGEPTYLRPRNTDTTVSAVSRTASATLTGLRPVSRTATRDPGRY
jgi:hypothetical protein